MHHSLQIRLWKMLVSTKKNLELAKSYTRSTDFIFVNIDFRDRGGILYSDQQTRFWVDSRKIETPSHDLDCKTVVFYSKSVKKWVKRGVRVLRARSSRASHALLSPQSRSLFSASFQTFSSTARAYLNTQQYGWEKVLSVHSIFFISLDCFLGSHR